MDGGLSADALQSQVEWPFGEEFLGGRHFLARMEKRAFAVLHTGAGSYQFFARVDKWDPADTWTEVLFRPAGVRSLQLPTIFKRRESTIGHGLETMDIALEIVAEHIAAGQPEDWEGADIEDEDESAGED